MAVKSALQSLGVVAVLVAMVAPAAQTPARAADTTVVITIKNHRFQPSDVMVPAGKRIRLVVKNQDDTPEEFESHELHREKVILGNSQGVILIGPLKPGTYPFFGEFHEKTAKGRIIAK
jgi:plastocyanin